jgi:hypothetical protein
MPRLNRLPADQPTRERQTHQDILVQEKRRSEITGWMKHSPEGQIQITEYLNDLHLIELLDKTARQLTVATEEPTKEVTDRAGRVVAHLTPMGKALVALCDAFDLALPARHGHHVFNPWVQAMVDALCQWHPGHEFGEASPNAGISRADRVRLGHIARYVKQTCQSRAFERRLQDERKLALQNLDGARSYLTWLFALHSQLLILRIDLYYYDKGEEWAGTAEALAAFERFVRMLRIGHIVTDVLGYLLSREVGPERGIHFHVMVILDGYTQKDAYRCTQVIGERWVNDYATAESGSFFNGYARLHEYEYNGLSLVHASDWQKLLGVLRAIDSMTKADYLIKVRASSKKCFRHGQIRPFNVTPGASRQSEHEMSTVWRILVPTGSGHLPG